MRGRPATVLGTLITEIAVVLGRVRDVTGPGVVHDRLPGLGEAGDESVNDHEDQEQTHGGG